jgi:hypothetical protein
MRRDAASAFTSTGQRLIGCGSSGPTTEVQVGLLATCFLASG